MLILYNILWQYSLSQLLPFTFLPSCPYEFVLSFLNMQNRNHEVHLALSKFSWDSGLTRCVIHVPVWFICKYHSVVEDWHSFTQKQSTSYSSIVSMYLFHTEILYSLSIWFCLVVSEKPCFLEVTCLLYLLQSSSSFFIYLCIFRKGSNRDIPFQAESSNASYYLYTNYLYICSNCQIPKNIWWEFSDALYSGFLNIALKDSLLLWSFSRNKSRLSLGPVMYLLS